MKIRQSDHRIYPVRFHHSSEVSTYHAMAHNVSRLPGATWLLVVYILLISCANVLESRAIPSRSTTDIPDGNSRHTSDANSTRDNPLDDLARVLGIRRVPIHLRHHSPPDYLRHLYHSTTDAEGIVQSPSPHHADTIFGYLNSNDSDSSNHGHYFYNVSRLSDGARFLYADFHVYRLHRRRSIRVKRTATQRHSVFLTLKLYKILDPSRRSTPFGNKLIDVKRITRNYYGWVVFNAKQAVKEWIADDEGNNHGFLITVQTRDGRFVDVNSMVFAQRFRHHDRLQPLLAVYTNHSHMNEFNTTSVSHETSLTRAFDLRDPNRYNRVYSRNFYIPPPRIRERRDVSSAEESMEEISTSNPSSRPRSRSGTRMERRSQRTGISRRTTEKLCSRRKMFVDFQKVGWDEWIISPAGFNAQICQGKCPYPLGQAYKPTNHAVVQSIIHFMKGYPNVHRPCCVPHKLKSISMLYYDEKYRVVLKQYEDMVVSSCGCE